MINSRDTLLFISQEHDELNGKKVRALSLEILKRRVDRGLYKRLDLLQRDVFLVLARARRLSRTDSQGRTRGAATLGLF